MTESKLSTPHLREFSRVVRAFVRENTAALRLPEAEAKKLELAAEEISMVIIDKFPANDDSPMDVSFNAFPDKITLEFTNKGIPMSGTIPEFDKENPLESIAGLSFHVINKMVDDCRLINKGLDGWLIVAEKKVSLPLLAEKQERAEKPAPSTEKYKIVRATPDMAEKIVKLTYLSYRYTMAVDIFYYADRIADGIENERIVSFVAVTDAGEIIAHVGTFLIDGRPLMEYDGLMVAPGFRGGGIIKEVSDIHDAYTKENYGDKFITICDMVTGHKKSQSIGEGYGFRPVGLFVSATPRFKFVAMDVSQQRSSFLFASMGDILKEIDLHIPKRFYEITGEIFSQFGTVVNFNAEDRVLREKTEFKPGRRDKGDAEEIEVKIGRDFASALAAKVQGPTERDIKTCYVLVPTDEPLPSDFEEIMRRSGLFFCGFTPREPGKWDMIYACIYRQKFNFGEILLHNPIAQKLTDLSEQLYGEVGS